MSLEGYQLSKELLPASWNRIHLASYQNRPELLKQLISESPRDVNSLDANGRSPLQLALESNNVECLAILLENGATMDTLSHGDTASGADVFTLHLFSDLTLQLIRCSPSARQQLPDVVMTTALCHAITEGDIGLMESILDNGNGHIINRLDNMGLSPLHHISIGHTPLQTAQILVDHGARVDTPSRTDLATPLHYACRHGNLDVVDLLLRSSDDPSKLLLCQDVLGRTASHVAIYNEQWDLVSGLVQSYSDLLESSTSVVDNRGFSVSSLLSSVRSSIPLSYQILIPCLSKDEANWMLHCAVSDESDELVEYSLSQGADPNVFDFSHQTPLILASKMSSGHASICRRLLEGGANPNLSDWGGRTALHYAAANGHQLTVRLLLDELLVDVYAMTRDGRVSLELALVNGHADVAHLLLAACQVKGGAGFTGDWMNLLSLSAPLQEMSIVKDIIDLFCPSNWPQMISEWPSIPIVSPPPALVDAQRGKVSLLKVVAPLEPAPRIFLKDVLHPAMARKKFRKHREEIASSSCQPFKEHQFFNINKKKFARKEFDPAAIRAHRSSSPIHAMFFAKNKPGFVYLIKEMKRGGCLSKFLTTKDPSRASGASLLARALSNGYMSADYKLELDLLNELTREFPLQEGVSIGWALLHLLTVKLATKKTLEETPLKKWPEWLISKHISHYNSFIKYSELSSLDKAMTLAVSILESEQINVFQSREESPRYCSLVFTATVNGVSAEFLDLLLTKGDVTLPLIGSESRHNSILKRSIFALMPQFAFTEALLRNYDQHALLILQKIELPTIFSSLIPESHVFFHLDPLGPFLLRLSQALCHIALNDKFELALNILQQFPKKYLNQYFLSSHSFACLMLSASSPAGEALGHFLLSGYLENLTSYARHGEDFDDETTFRFDKLLNNLPKLLNFVDYIYPRCKWTFDHFDIFRDILTFFQLRGKQTHSKIPFLHEFCGHGYTQVVKFLLSGQDKEIVMSEKCGFTPIYFACLSGHVEIVEFLLEQGATLEPNEYGLYHPLFGVLMYFNRISVLFQRNSYRNCKRLNVLSEDLSYSCSWTFKDQALSRKLVDLVLPTSDQIKRLAQPVQYLKALVNVHQHDLQPLAGLLDIFPWECISVEEFMSISLEVKNYLLSDYALYTARHCEAHPSPVLCQKFLTALVSFVSPSNPYLAAKLCYWDVVIASIPARPPRAIENQVLACRWADIFVAAICKQEREVARHIVSELIKRKEEKIDESTLLKVIVALCKCGDDELADLLTDMLTIPLSDETVLCGLKAAARNGNFAALESLCSHSEDVLKQNLTSVLSSAASAGQESIVISLTTHQVYVKCLDGLPSDTKLSFWVTVLEAAAKHGRSDMALFALGFLSYQENLSLSSWSEFPQIVNSCCWWGLSTVLESLSIEDSNVYLIDVGGYTPFESACGSGHYADLAESKGFRFPQLKDILVMREISECLYSSYQDDNQSDTDSLLEDTHIDYNSCLHSLLVALSTGWFSETMRLSQELEDVRGFLLADASVRLDLFGSSTLDIFVKALLCNCQMIVEGFLNCWGSNAGVIIQALKEVSGDCDVVQCAVKSRDSAMFDTLLQPLFDSGVPREIVTAESVREAMIQDDVSKLSCLVQWFRIDVTQLKLASHGYNVLHMLALYSSSEMCDFVIPLVSDLSLLAVKDRSGLIPCECALLVGNYPVASKLLVLMRKQGLPVPPSIEKKMSLKATGWFKKLMALNEESPSSREVESLAPPKGISLREAPSLRQYYDSIKHTQVRTASVLLEASLGRYSVSTAVLEYPIATGTILQPSLPLMTLGRLRAWLNSAEYVKWVRGGYQDQVIDVFRHLTSRCGQDIKSADVTCLFETACTCSARKMIAYLLGFRGLVDQPTVLRGFSYSIACGDLETAAYIINISGLPQMEFGLEVIEMDLSELVRLVFFGSPESIVSSLCSPVIDEESRITLSQGWLMYPWGRYQMELLRERLPACIQLLEDWQYQLAVEENDKVSLKIDYQSFSGVTNSKYCPLSHHIIVKASCLSELLPISQAPPIHSLSSLFPDTPLPNELTLSCVLHPSRPMAKSAGYHGNVTVSYNPRTGTFKWPETETRNVDIPSANEVSWCYVQEPLVAINERTCHRIKTAQFNFPISVSLDSLEDYVAMQSESSVDWKQLSCVIEQAIGDIISLLKLAQIPGGLYTECELLPCPFQAYSRHFIALYTLSPHLLKSVEISFDVSMSNSVSCMVSEDGGESTLCIELHLELMDDDTPTVIFTPPTHSDYIAAVAQLLLTAEMNYLQQELRQSLGTVSLYFDNGESLNNCSLQSLHLLKLHPLIDRFIRYFITLMEHGSFSSFNIVLTCDTQLELSGDTLRVGVIYLTEHGTHSAMQSLKSLSVGESPHPSFSRFPLALNRDFLYSASDEAKAELCSPRGDLVRRETVNKVKSSKIVEWVSLDVGEPIQYSPLVRSKIKDEISYSVDCNEDVPVITASVNDTLCFIVSHPGGGCSGAAATLILPHYVSVRERIAPRRGRRRIDVKSFVAKEHNRLHYMSCLRDGETGDRLAVAATAIANSFRILLVSKGSSRNCHTLRGSTISSYSLGHSIYRVHVQFMTSLAEAGYMLACCNYCQCIMPIHWPQWTSSLSQSCVISPGKMSSVTSFVTLRRTSKAGMRIPPIKAGGRLKVYLFPRDEYSNPISWSDVPPIFLQSNVGDDFTCQVQQVKSGIYLVLSSSLEKKGQYVVKVQLDQTTSLQVAFFKVVDHSSVLNRRKPTLAETRSKWVSSY